MLQRPFGSWMQRWLHRSARRDLSSLLATVCALLLMLLLVPSQVAAQEGAPNSAIALTIERCERSPFDVDEYERVLAVELRVLNAQATDATSDRRLIVRSPGCNHELEVRLEEGERSSSELVRASDYAGVGQPRALALATIETLRVLATRLQASAPPPADVPAAAAPPPTPEQPAAPVPEPRSAPEPEPALAPEPVPSDPASLELYAGIGGGLFDTLDWQAELGGAVALTRAWWLETELAFGQASDDSALGSVDASAFTLAASLELRLRLAGPFELSIGAGARGGAAWASADSALPLLPDVDQKSALAPVLLAFAELGIALEVADGLHVGLVIEPGLAIEAAHFLGPSGATVEAEDAASASQPRVDVLGHGVYGSLTLGYRF
jgi:hypothetical protein